MEKEIQKAYKEYTDKVSSVEEQYHKGLITFNEYIRMMADYQSEYSIYIFDIVDAHLRKM